MLDQSTIRFTFIPAIPLKQAWQTLWVARYATEGLFGTARMRLEVACRRDRLRNSIEITGAEEITSSLAQSFAGLLNREFGERAFQMRRVERRALAEAAT